MPIRREPMWLACAHTECALNSFVLLRKSVITKLAPVFPLFVKKNYIQETNSIALQSNPKKLCLLETLVCVPDGPGCAYF